MSQYNQPAPVNNQDFVDSVCQAIEFVGKIILYVSIVLWNTYIYLGGKIFKNIMACHCFTLVLILTITGSNLQALESSQIAKQAQASSLENADLKAQLAQRQSEIDNALDLLTTKATAKGVTIEPQTPTQVKAQALKASSIPTKWQAHVEYVKSKLADDKALQGAVNGYKENQDKFGFYSKSDCHPFIMGSIHYREYGYTLRNGWNGQGMYQNLDNKYGQDTVVNNATAQTVQACDFLKGKAKSCQKYGQPSDLNNLDNIELIGCSLAKYNGCMSKHFNDCGYTVKGLSSTQENFLKCSVDFTCPMVPEKQLGALTVILALQLSE
jgi:hypothetical protein